METNHLLCIETKRRRCWLWVINFELAFHEWVLDMCAYKIYVDDTWLHRRTRYILSYIFVNCWVDLSVGWPAKEILVQIRSVPHGLFQSFYHRDILFILYMTTIFTLFFTRYKKLKVLMPPHKINYLAIRQASVRPNNFTESFITFSLMKLWH